MRVGAKVLKTKFIENPSSSDLKKWIDWHKQQRVRYDKLEEYYKGNQAILRRDDVIAGRADEKLVTNFCELITNTLTGYFISRPVEYRADNGKDIKELKEINEENTISDVDFDIAENMSIYGHGFQILYYDENAEIKVESCSPKDTFLLYDINKIGEKPIAAIRYQEITDEINRKTKILIDYITEGKVTKFVTDNFYQIEIGGEEVPHNFRGLPITEFLNNSKRKGDFEGILTLQDAYNLSASERVNDVVNTVQALLIFKNYPMPDKETRDIIRKEKMAGLDNDGDAKYLSSNLDGTTAKSTKDDIATDIHKISNCPDMSDNNFSGNSSGVAMKYKLWGAEQIVSTKERKFKKGLKARLKLIARSPKTKSFDYKNVIVKFNRNIPVNNTELIESLVLLKGVISDESLFNQMKFLGIADPQKEIERIQNENAKLIEIEGFGE